MSKRHILRCASPCVVAAYEKVRLTPRDLHALSLTLLQSRQKLVGNGRDRSLQGGASCKRLNCR